jgi:hypothetical protein
LSHCLPRSHSGLIWQPPKFSWFTDFSVPKCSLLFSDEVRLRVIFSQID